MTSTPTQNIRLTITVSPEVHTTFQRLANASGTSLGKTMGEWLESTAEGAEFMASKLEDFKTQPQKVMRQMHGYAAALADETEAFVAAVRQKGMQAQSGLACDARSGPEGPIPPSGNTGGKGAGKATGKPGSKARPAASK